MFEGNLSKEKSGKKSWKHIKEFRSRCSHIRTAIEYKYCHRTHLHKEKVQDTGRPKFNSRQLSVGEIKNKRWAGHTYAGSHYTGQ